MPWMGDAHNRYYAEGGTVTDQQIREWYEANRGAENFGELARREMENSGLTNERVNAALTPVQQAPQWQGGEGGNWVVQDPGATDRAAAFQALERARQQHTYNNFAAANPLDANAATGRGTGTDVAQYSDRKQTLQEFLTENAAFINPDGTIKSPEQGGNYHYAGQNALDVYNSTIGRKETPAAGGSWGDWFEAPEAAPNAVSLAWVPGVENKGSFLQNLAKVGLAGAGMYFGLPALLGAGGAGAAAAAGAGTAAPGLAGMVGMNAGMGATALNAGALNAGMTALRGGNLEDSLRSGLVGAALSPVGTMAGKAATSALGSTVTNPNLLKAVGTVAGNTAVGGAGAALTGRDIGKGLTSGALNGLVSAAGSYVGGQAAQAAGGNKLVGGAAAIGTQAALTGRKIRPEQLIGLGLDGIAAKVDGVDPALAKSILSVLVARDPTNAAARIALNNIVRTGAVMGKPTRRNASGGHIKRNFYEGDFVDSGENSGDGGDSITFGWEPTVDDEEVVNPIVDDSPMPYRPSIDSEAANHEGQTYEEAYKAYLEQLAIAEYIQRYENDPNQTNAETMRLLRNNEMLANGESPLSWGELEGIDTNGGSAGGGGGGGSGFDWGSLLKALTGLAAVNEATRANSGASNTAAYGTPESLRTGTATSVDPTDYKYTFDPRTGKYTLVGDPAAAVVHGATGVDMYGANERAHIPAAAKGGAIQNAGLAAAHASTKPRFIQGAGDGLSDSVPVQMDDGGPGRLADGEFVIPADVVSGLGNGSSKAGAKLLYQMMDNIRKRAHGHTRQTRPIDPKKVLPA